MEFTVDAYAKADRDALPEISMQAWALVFAQTRACVPGFVYDSFYPNGWTVARYFKDLR